MSALWLRERYKDLVIIFLSANTKQIPETLASHHGSIPKPIRESGFVQTLQYLLEVLRAPPPKGHPAILPHRAAPAAAAPRRLNRASRHPGGRRQPTASAASRSRSSRRLSFSLAVFN